MRAALLLVLCLCAGCAITTRRTTTVITQGPNGWTTNTVKDVRKEEFAGNKIVAVKIRFFGLMAGQNPATQTPEVKLGWGSSVVMMVPVSTNAVFAPRYFDVFEIGQGLNPFSTHIAENAGFGDVSVGTNATGAAVIPKAAPPSAVFASPKFGTK